MLFFFLLARGSHTLFQEKHTAHSDNVCMCSLNSGSVKKLFVFDQPESLTFQSPWYVLLNLFVSSSFTVPFIQTFEDLGQVPGTLP